MPESGTMNYLSAAGLDPRRTLEKLIYPPARVMQKKKGGGWEKATGTGKQIAKCRKQKNKEKREGSMMERDTRLTQIQDRDAHKERRRKIVEWAGVASIFILGLAFGRKVEDAMTRQVAESAVELIVQENMGKKGHIRIHAADGSEMAFYGEITIVPDSGEVEGK